MKMSSQGYFKKIVPMADADDWFSKQQDFIYAMFDVDKDHRELSGITFNCFTRYSVEEEEIPDGFVVAVIEYSKKR